MGKSKPIYSGLVPIHKVAEIQLSYKPTTSLLEQPKVNSSKDAERILRALYKPEEIELRESFYVLCLSRSNRVIASYQVSAGGISGTVADNKLIFACCLLTAASSLIITHNHPSGNLKPSKADEALTRKVKEGAQLLDLQLLDHVILSADGYFSFADEGLL